MNECGMVTQRETGKGRGGGGGGQVNECGMVTK